METGLAWPIKSSFLRYVNSDSTAEVTIAAGAGELVRGGYYFTSDEITETRFSFRGVVSFRAHGGLLRVVIADPVVDVADAVMLVRVDNEGTLRPLVDLEIPPSTRDGDYVMWQNVRTALREESVPAFGDVYGPGTPFDPLTLRVCAADN